MTEALCPICGERDPGPRWICLLRVTGNAKPNEPCPYSLDGSDRMKARFAARAALTEESGASRSGSEG